MRRNALLSVIIGMFVGCGTGEQGDSPDEAPVPVASTEPDEPSIPVAITASDQPSEPDGPLGVGATPPKLLAAGWLNGTTPSESELAGKVVVVDVWAYW